MISPELQAALGQIQAMESLIADMKVLQVEREAKAEAKIERLTKALQHTSRVLVNLYSDILNPKGVSSNRLCKWMRKLRAECDAALSEGENKA